MNDDNTDIAICRHERLSKTNLNHLDILYNAVYNKPQSSGYFAQKYNTAYTGTENIGFIAYNDNQQPIAYYGVIPCFIQHYDQLILAAQSVDTMTHPDYRFKGLFIQLAELTFDLCRTEGIKLIFGFPNQNSLKGFMKLGWQTTEIMNNYQIPVTCIPLESMAKRSPLLKKLYNTWQQQILKKHLLPQKGIESSVFKDGFAGVHRNDQYLNHKTYSDTQVLLIGRSLVWVKVKNGLVIGDMNYTAADFDDAIYGLKQLAARLGLRQILFQISSDTALATVFAKKHSSTPAFHVIIKDLGTDIPLDKIKFTFADVDIF
jgi:hypothetical protein